MFKIEKDTEKNRIILTISGDEIMIWLPPQLIECMDERIEQEDGVDGGLEEEMDEFEKGFIRRFIPMNEVVLKGF